MPEQSVFEAAINAVIDGHLDTLKSLLTQHPDLATAHSEEDHHATLLHYVAANGVEDELQRVPANAVKIATALFEAGANPQTTSDIYGGGNGSTPLIAVISCGHIHEAGLMGAMIACFCEHGANPDGINSDGLPLATALAFPYPESVPTLLKYGATLKNIVLAAGCGSQETVQAMLDQSELAPHTTPCGNKITDRQELLNAALVAASTFNHRDVVALLLQRGADINGMGATEESTALREAVRMNHPQLVTFLLEQGADVHTKDNQDFTPLHYAAWFGRIPLIDELLAHGADLEARNSYGGTVLDTFVWSVCNSKPPRHYLDVVKHLISAGADINSVDYPSCDEEVNHLLQTAMQ